MSYNDDELIVGEFQEDDVDELDLDSEFYTPLDDYESEDDEEESDEFADDSSSY